MSKFHNLLPGSPFILAQIGCISTTFLSSHQIRGDKPCSGFRTCNHVTPQVCAALRKMSSVLRLGVYRERIEKYGRPPSRASQVVANPNPGPNPNAPPPNNIPLQPMPANPPPAAGA